MLLRRLRLRHALLGAGSAQAGSTGAAGEDGSGGGGGGGLVGASVLEQNINAAFAPCFPGDHHGRLALAVFCFHIDSVLQGGRDTNQIFNTIYRLNITPQGESFGIECSSMSVEKLNIILKNSGMFK